MSEILAELHQIDACRGLQPVLRDISMSIKAAQHVAILGPNGSGKSTLLKLLAREVYPLEKSDSYLRLLGREQIDLQWWRQHMGWVSHEAQTQFLTLATAKEAVASGFFGGIGLKAHHRPSESQLAAAEDALRVNGLYSLSTRRFLDLSTGEQRRVLLQRAFIHSPSLVLLDEASSALDIRSRIAFEEELRTLMSHTTLVMATHHVDEILPGIEHLILIKGGKILASGPKSELLTDAQLSALYDVKLRVFRHNDRHHWQAR